MKRLTKSREKKLAGVCAGIAEYVDVDPTVVRVLYAVISFFSAVFPGILFYIILCILMPDAEA